jgi:hypothetical protein
MPGSSRPDLVQVWPAAERGELVRRQRIARMGGEVALERCRGAVVPAERGRIIPLMTLLLGIAYPPAMLAFGQALFPDRANGSLIEKDGAVVGSGRPSAVGYDDTNSSGTNPGPTKRTPIVAGAERVEAVRQADGVARPPDTAPVEAGATHG